MHNDLLQRLDARSTVGAAPEVARFVASLRFEHIPARVIERFKLLMLDGLGCAMFGAQTPWAQSLVETLTEFDTDRSCRVWGTRASLSAVHAVFANGALTNAVDLDDTHAEAAITLAAVTLPVLLALAERDPLLSGQAILSAGIAGYEAGPRVGLAIGWDAAAAAQGCDPTATYGVIAACAAAAATLRLDTGACLDAFGLASSRAIGVGAAHRSPTTRPLQIGRAAQAGFYAALLARGGVRARDRLHDDDGRSAAAAEPAAAHGQRWETMRVGLKFYACIDLNHAALEALRRLRQRYAFAPDDVHQITIHAARQTVAAVGDSYEPDDLSGAQLNLAYCVATYLLEGDAFVEQFTQSKVADPMRIALSRRIDVIEDLSITAGTHDSRRLVRLELVLRNGLSACETVTLTSGAEHDFPDESRIIAKFHRLARLAWPAASVDGVIEAVMQLDRLPSAATLTTHLARPQ